MPRSPSPPRATADQLVVSGGWSRRSREVLIVRSHVPINESQLARDSCSLTSTMLNSRKPQRLTLRSFREEDLDAMAELLANPDFMRFSLGVFTERKQTIAFIEKVTVLDRAGLPSQFAVVPRGEDAIVGYCGFIITLKCQEKSRSGTHCIPITGTAASSLKRHARARSRVCRFKTATRNFAGSSGKHPVTSRGGKEWNGGGKGNYVSGFSDAGVCGNSRTLAEKP